MLWDVPTFPQRAEATVPPNTSVDILDVTWPYAQEPFVGKMCYMYYVRVVGTQIEGWIEQDRRMPR
jgi:hypothetical protein